MGMERRSLTICETKKIVASINAGLTRPKLGLLLKTIYLADRTTKLRQGLMLRTFRNFRNFDSTFYAFLGLCFFVGFFTNLTLLRAQAEFLRSHDAISLTLLSFLATSLTQGFIAFGGAQRIRFRFAATLAALTLAFGLLNFFAESNSSSSEHAVYAWVFGAVLAIETLRWGLFELLERHFNPAQVGSLGSYQLIATDLGSFIAISFLFASSFLTSEFYISMQVFSVLSIVALAKFAFLNPRSLELKTPDRLISHKTKNRESLNSMFMPILFMGLIFGLYRLTQDALVKDFFRTHSSDPNEIQRLLAAAGGAGTLVSISLYFLNARVLEKWRFSPIKTWFSLFSFIGIFAGLAYIYPSTLSFIALSAASRGFNGLYFPSLRRVTSSFEIFTRLKLDAAHTHASLVGAGVIFFAITHFLGKSNMTPFWVSIPIVIVMAIPTIFLINKRLLRLLEKLSMSQSVAEAFRAIIGLSYLQPMDFVSRMQNILIKDPEQVLRKQILLGLGYSRKDESVTLLEQEFESDKEEIQLTVLDALKTSGHFRATRFALELVLSNKKVISSRIRLNAAQIIAALYGKQSIPILMLGLSKNDLRQTANILEALSTFSSEGLVETFRGFLQSKEPRVRANALLGLFKNPEQKELYKNEIKRSLQKRELLDLNEIISILYIIGKNRDHEFEKEIILVFNHFSPQIRDQDKVGASFLQVAGWTFIRLGITDGYRVVFERLLSTYQSGTAHSVLHFFMQLDEYERFDCIDKWVRHSKDSSVVAHMLLEVFEKSGYEFIDEAEYTRSILLTIQKTKTAS